jgi:hypothetical protein
MFDKQPSVRDKQGVFARVGKMLMVAALICAIGGHWAMLQSVAWATMLADHARTDSLGAAIEKTLDGRHPCPLCKQIAQGRKSERKTDWQAGSQKLEFPRHSVVFVFNAPVEFYLQDDFHATARLLAETPPVPPPRSLLG